MRFSLILAVLLILPIALAEDNFYYKNEEITYDVQTSSNISLISSSSRSEIDYVKATLFYFPKEGDKQHIESIKATPNAPITGEAITFEWHAPGTSTLPFSVDATIRIDNIPVKVKSKVYFPIDADDLPGEIKPYLEPSEIIDSGNRAIIKLASQLAEGDDDLFSVAHKLATWTKTNVNYTLDTLTENVSQKASWVLTNREGVCDELTALFIAMARSLGIPAKYISGEAYTNYNNINDWGPHAWAELYFPGYGWVPYDVTYGEIGFVDGSHIKLKESVDASTTSSKYEWRSFNVDVQTEKISFKVIPKAAGSEFAEELAIKAYPFTDHVAFNGYNIIIAEVQNLEDYYISTELAFDKPAEVKAIGEQRQQVVLKPKETRALFWLVQVPGLDEKYIYTFPFRVSTVKNESGKSMFEASGRGQYNSREEMEAIIQARQQQDAKVYATKFDFKCSIQKAEFYSDEQAQVACSIRNKGTSSVNAKACLQQDCRPVALSINQQQDVAFPFKAAPGNKQIPVTLSYNGGSESVLIPVNVLDLPRIDIKDLRYPEQVRYADEFELVFVIDKSSASNPKNAELLIDGPMHRKVELGPLDRSVQYRINVRGRDLKEGNNTITLSIGYQDSRGKEYSTSESAAIELVDVTFMQKILLFFNRLLSFNSL
ncbi:transglutaminase domain-containing protein [Candidatus Woesearchaeota archaeon]|nr:transglutaminase domain-containing protein [Candidatus Woesearchaeota archaeon]